MAPASTSASCAACSFFASAALLRFPASNSFLSRLATCTRLVNRHVLGEAAWMVGGLAEVWRATDRTSGMNHAIKIGDVQDVLRRERANSFDACLTDPPYGLGFMGKQWDKGVPGADVWRDVLRVLKPGALMLAFGGTRTYHRLACAIEDAGFEIRDCLMWLYGSGFPKNKSLLKPAWEPIILARKRGAAQVLNIDALRVGTEGGCRPVANALSDKPSKNTFGGGLNGFRSDPVDGLGRWPTNVLLDEAAAAQLGEAARFFYVAKASPRERNAGLEIMRRRKVKGGFLSTTASKLPPLHQNIHPTVKPIKLDTELARYLLTLLCPPAAGRRRLLVPFSGSGSEILGARAAGWDYVLGIEREKQYAAIAEGRLAA